MLENNLDKIWDKRWAGFDKKEKITFVGKIFYRAKQKALVQVLRNIKVDDVIEVGCGLGYTLQVYHAAGLRCLGIDVSPQAVSVCRTKGLKAELKKLEEVSGNYDLVSSDGLLEHFLNPELYAKHLMRLSSKYVLLIQPNHDSLPGKTLAYLAELFRSKVNVHEYNYRIKDFIYMFQNNGFVIERNFSIFFDVFRLLLFKRITG